MIVDSGKREHPAKEVNLSLEAERPLNAKKNKRVQDLVTGHHERDLVDHNRLQNHLWRAWDLGRPSGASAVSTLRKRTPGQSEDLAERKDLNHFRNKQI